MDIYGILIIIAILLVIDIRGRMLQQQSIAVIIIREKKVILPKWYDPYDNQPIEGKAVLVQLHMPIGRVTIGVSQKNLEKVVKNGLPRGSISFVRGRMYFVSVNGASTLRYMNEYHPDIWNIWDVPWFKQAFADYDDFQEQNFNQLESI